MHAQANVPPAAVLMVGVRVTVTACPTLDAAVVPVTLITPPVVTEAVVTLPAAAIEQAPDTVVGMDNPPAVCVASLTQVRAALAANTSSDTRALTV